MRRVRIRAATLFVLALAMGVAARSQNGAARVQFDVASVKIDDGPMVPRVSGRVTGGPGTEDPGRITYTRVALTPLIMRAYGVKIDQLYGRFDNILGLNYSISAAMPPTTTAEQLQVMLQNLLASRFHLALHHETRNFPGYELVIAGGGPKFGKWTPDPNAAPAALRQPLQPGQSGYHLSTQSNPPLIRVVNRQPLVRFIDDLQELLLMSNNALNDADLDEQMAAAARGNPGAFPYPPMPRFVDKTGLDGAYEFTLEFEGSMLPGIFMNAGRVPSIGGTTLFAALEKQLGLKLVKVKNVPVDVLVIDHIDRVPTEN